MDATLLKLPWATLLTLAGGYAAYFVANLGVRSHHQTIDVAFSTLVFGFFTAFAYEASSRLLKIEILWSSLIAFVSAVLLGALWGRFGRRWLLRLLRLTDVSHNNDLPSAWAELFSDTRVGTSQLSVRMKDGTWLKCDDLRKFDNKPYGPCILGGTGDILIYVTHQQSPDDEAFEECTQTLNAAWGDEVTYVPAAEVSRVDIRRKWKA